jgi:hypothetical protein
MKHLIVIAKFILIMLGAGFIPTLLLIILWLVSFGGFPLLEFIHYPLTITISAMIIIIAFVASIDSVQEY